GSWVASGRGVTTRAQPSAGAAAAAYWIMMGAAGSNKYGSCESRSRPGAHVASSATGMPVWWPKTGVACQVAPSHEIHRTARYRLGRLSPKLLAIRRPSRVVYSQEGETNAAASQSAFELAGGLAGLGMVQRYRQSCAGNRHGRTFGERRQGSCSRDPN